MSELIVESLWKEYTTRGEPLIVLQGCNLRLKPGQDVAVLGPSGSGKSTLLHILGTLDNPTRGSVSLGGQNPFALGPRELALFRNARIGFVFQDHHLFPQCTVLENVLLPALAAGLRDSAQLQRAKELLSRVRLDHRLDHRPAELSGGERQRAAVARALLRKPSLLLADEPTGNLDRVSAELVADLLLEMHRAEQTILVVVTHSQSLAERISQRLELNDGQLEPVA